MSGLNTVAMQSEPAATVAKHAFTVPTESFVVVETTKRKPCALHCGYRYRIQRRTKTATSWACVKEKSEKCRGRMVTTMEGVIVRMVPHLCTPAPPGTLQETYISKRRKRRERAELRRSLITGQVLPSGKVDEATTSTVQSSGEGVAQEVDAKEDLEYYNEAMEEVTIKEESVDCIIGNAADEENMPKTPFLAQWHREPSPPAEDKRLLPLSMQPNGDIRVTVTNLEAVVRACRQEQDEFDLFGKTVAAHLRQLPLRPALAAQCTIQQVLADARLTAQQTGWSTT